MPCVTSVSHHQFLKQCLTNSSFPQHYPLKARVNEWGVGWPRTFGNLPTPNYTGCYQCSIQITSDPHFPLLGFHSLASVPLLTNTLWSFLQKAALGPLPQVSGAYGSFLLDKSCHWLMGCGYEVWLPCHEIENTKSNIWTRVSYRIRLSLKHFLKLWFVWILAFLFCSSPLFLLWALY